MELNQSPSRTSRTRQIAFALPSFLLGLWAFIKVNSVSGPVFEPIIEACTSHPTAAEFASQTAYHAYEPIVGLGVPPFNILVCLITQFIYELRQTHPAGIIVWGGVVVVSLPFTVMSVFEAGRRGARGPVLYPVIMGLLYQLLGVSVAFPMLWIPSYIFGRGERGAPLTQSRIVASVALVLPGVVLTTLVFTASTDSYLWTVCAGILGGPIVALFGLVLWRDGSERLPSVPTRDQRKDAIRSVKSAYRTVMVVGFIGWMCLVGIVYQWYGGSGAKTVMGMAGLIWKDIWVDANASVKFMTIDTGVFYVALILFVAYHDARKAVKMVRMTPLLGPGAAGCWVLEALEVEAMSAKYESLEVEKMNMEGKKDT